MYSRAKPVLKDEFDIEAEVGEPQLSPDGTFFTYRLAGQDKTGPFDIRRRFSQFWALREALVRNWIGVYVPPLPEKKPQGTKEVTFQQQRMSGLNYFIKKLSKMKYFFYSEEVQAFLKVPDAVKVLLTIHRPADTVLKQRYSGIFSPVLAGLNLSKLDGEVASFTAALQNARKNLQFIKEKIVDLSQAKECYSKNWAIFATDLMPMFEENLLSIYCGEETTPFRSQAVKESMQIVMNDRQVGLRLISQLIKLEQGEVIAFLQARSVQQLMQNSRREKTWQREEAKKELAKLRSGEKTVKGFFKDMLMKMNKEQQLRDLQQKIQSLNKEIQAEEELLGQVGTLWVNEEGRKFRQQRFESYRLTMERVAAGQLQQLQTYSAFIRSLQAQLPI